MTFTTALIWIHPDFTKAFYLEIDALDFTLGGVFSQMGKDEKLHPIAFYSQKCFVIEINFEIHDNNFFAIVHSF